MELKELIKKDYDYRMSSFERTKEEATFIINSFLNKTEIKIHSVQSRIKEVGSFLSKVETLEIKDSETAFSQINDIIGLRIICLFLSDIGQITTQLKEHFEIVQEDNKLDESEVSSFGYFSIHYLCKLPESFKGPRYDDIKDVIFEIQVRTISMDAWANISHYLDYKSEIEIPKELKKDFFALSGLFYVADTHFEMFFKNKKKQSSSTLKELSKHHETEINFDTLENYISQKFKKNKKPSAESISILTRSLILNNYITIKQLDDKLEEFYQSRPDELLNRHFNQVGMIRHALSISDSNWDESKNELRQNLILRRGIKRDIKKKGSR